MERRSRAGQTTHIFGPYVRVIGRFQFAPAPPRRLRVFALSLVNLTARGVLESPREGFSGKASRRIVTGGAVNEVIARYSHRTIFISRRRSRADHAAADEFWNAAYRKRPDSF